MPPQSLRFRPVWLCHLKTFSALYSTARVPPHDVAIAVLLHPQCIAVDAVFGYIAGDASVPAVSGLAWRVLGIPSQHKGWFNLLLDVYACSWSWTLIAV